MSNERLLSVPPTAYNQAIQIATQRPQTFKNWQAVIRLAIQRGLPLIGQTQQSPQPPQPKATDYTDVRTFTQQSNKQRDTYEKVNKTVPTPSRTCEYGGVPGCKTMGCANCTNTDIKASAKWLKVFG